MLQLAQGHAVRYADRPAKDVVVEFATALTEAVAGWFDNAAKQRPIAEPAWSLFAASMSWSNAYHARSIDAR